jgi:G:T-mismatch repair DNA endonuclease (very short patch repair protein)
MSELVSRQMSAMPSRDTGTEMALAANVARDRRNDDYLQKLGWIIVHVWEHEDPSIAAEAINELWRTRLQETTRRGLTNDVGRT